MKLINYLKQNNIGYTDKDDNLTVGGYLDLEGTKITNLPDNLTVGGDLDLRGTEITNLPDNLTVGGDLYLRGTKITNLPDNLTVGGDLDLRGTKITNLPDNLTVGGDLDLEGTKITNLPDNLTVGGYLDLEGTKITQQDYLKIIKNSKKINWNKKLSWRNDKYRKIDGIFCEIINIKKNIMKVKVRNEINFIITDGENYSHGKTIKKAKEDLIYKISNRDISVYKTLNKDSILTFEEAIKMYRIITGACEAGTKNFINGLSEIKKEYSIKEIIELTKNEFGNNDLIKFFNQEVKF